MSNYLHRKLMTDKEKEMFVNLLQLCPAGFGVFPKIKMAELFKPSAEFGTETFISEFKEINKVTVDFALFDINKNYTVTIISYQEDGDFSDNKISLLHKICSELNVNFYKLDRISELYLVDLFKGRL